MAYEALIPALAQAGMSIYQFQQAKKLAKDRPEYQIPEAVLQQVDLAKRGLSQTESPYATMARQDLAQGTATGMAAAERGATSGIDVLGYANKLAANQQAQAGKLANMNISYDQQQQQNLNRILATLAGEQGKAFQYNVAQPYAADAAARSALLGSGIQNLFGAVKNYSTVSSQDAYNQQYFDLLKSLQQPSGTQQNSTPNSLIDWIKMSNSINDGNVPAYNQNQYGTFLG